MYVPDMLGIEYALQFNFQSSKIKLLEFLVQYLQEETGKQERGNKDSYERS